MKIMKRKSVSILLAAILCVGAAFPAYIQDEKVEAQESQATLQGLEPIEGRVIVKVNPDFEGAKDEEDKKNSTSSEDSYTMETLLTMSESEEDANSTKAKSSANETEKMMVAESDELSTEELVKELEDCPGVEYVEPDYAIQSYAVPNDTYFAQQWNLQRQTSTTPGAANVPYVWGATEGSDEYVVAVVDSGVDYNHPDLKDNMWTDENGNHGYDFSGDALTSSGDTDPMDVFGHGTHVAGIIGASGNNNMGVSGVAQKVKIAALRVLDNEGQGSTSMAIKAYEYMLEQKEKGVNFVAANNSWGGAYLSRSFQDIVDYAAKQGIVSVFASGNTGADMDANVNAPYGSNTEGTIVVNASDQYGHAADYSNYGKINTELFAPGDKILSTKPGTILQKEKYGIMSGTSMAAPNVTGAYALLKAYYGNSADMSEIRARLAGGVTRTEELKDLCVSGGYLNLQKAIESPYPVLDELSQKDGQAVISGYFFGNGMGTVVMDGQSLPIVSWGDREITVELPKGTVEGPHEFVVTAASDASQYGRDTFVLENKGVIVENETLFDELPVPDYEKLGVSLYDDESMMYSVESVSGNIYVTGGDLYEMREGERYVVLLVYNTDENEWDKISTWIPLGLDVKLTVSGDTLYIYSNKGTGFEIYSYDTAQNTEFVKVAEFARSESIQNSSIATDGNKLYVVGGSERNPSDGTYAPTNKVYSVDLLSGACVEVARLANARVNASVEIMDGKLIAVGGENADGQWENSVEIFDGSKWTAGVSYPNVYENQMPAAASGVYAGQMVVSGMMSDEAHTSDTYLYNVKDGKWMETDKNLDDEKVYFADGVVSGDYFYVFGTTHMKNDTMSKFYRLDMTKVNAVPAVPGDDTKNPADVQGGDDTKNQETPQKTTGEPSDPVQGSDPAPTTKDPSATITKSAVTAPKGTAGKTASGTGNKNKVSVKSVKSTKSTKTGDESTAAVWSSLLCAAGAAVVIGKRKRQ